MERITSRISLILTGVVLLAAALALATVRQPDDCRPDVLQPRIAAAIPADSPRPTLAPPQNVVLVQVEADKSDIEVGWAEH